MRAAPRRRDERCARALVCAEGDRRAGGFDGQAPSGGGSAHRLPAGAGGGRPARDDDDVRPEPAAEPEMYLEESDLYSTKWSIVATPGEDSWMQGGPQEQARALSRPPKLRGPHCHHRAPRRNSCC